MLKYYKIKSEMIQRSYWFFIMVLMFNCSGSKGTNSEAQINSYDGIWAESSEANALFTIKGDTIINFEHGDRMSYKVIGDTMIIDYGDFIGKHFILKHTNDSLVLQNEDRSITRLYRR